MERLEAIVAGKVQGVWFRDFTQKRAEELGLTGHARNMPDGTVRVVAEGVREKLEALLRHLHAGPEEAQVESVAAAWKAGTDAHSDFHIL